MDSLALSESVCLSFPGPVQKSEAHTEWFANITKPLNVQEGERFLKEYKDNM